MKYKIFTITALLLFAFNICEAQEDKILSFLGENEMIVLNHNIISQYESCIDTLDKELQEEFCNLDFSKYDKTDLVFDSTSNNTIQVLDGKTRICVISLWDIDGRSYYLEVNKYNGSLERGYSISKMRLQKFIREKNCETIKDYNTF